MTRKTYKYKTFDFDNALAYVTGIVNGDAYFAETLDGESKSEWDKALAEGYRWVRTDRSRAILEQETELERAE